MTAHAEHPGMPRPSRPSRDTQPDADGPHDGHEHGSQRASHPGCVLAAAAVLLAIAVIALVYLLVHRHHAESRERQALDAERARGLRLSVARVETTPQDRTINLPGDLRGYNQSTIYAKLSGYVSDVRVERGDHVRRGQVLAMIESPESAKDVAAALHDAQIAKSNADRAVRLAPSGIIAQQDRDTAVAQSGVAEANLERARVILGYTKVTAPFDGIVTQRYVDPGMLLPAATTTTQSAIPIVDVADVDTLRAFVYVGQDVASFVHLKDGVTLWEDEAPQSRVQATVTRVAGALDPRTRTMQVEIDFDNRSWRLLPGTFAHVEIHIAAPPSPLVPDSAIVIRDGKTMAAVVDGGHVRFVPIELGYNDGSKVNVLGGLKGGETVGVDVPVELREGDPVQAAPQAASSGAAPASGLPGSTKPH